MRASPTTPFIINDNNYNMAGNSIFSHEQEKGTDSKLGNWYQELLDKQDKGFSIKYVSSSSDDKNIYLTFEISQSNLKKFDAIIFVQEMNATNEVAINKKIKLQNSKTQKITVSFLREKEFDKFPWQDGFVYQATITCDSFSAQTLEFELKFEKEKEEKTEKCLCKKTTWSADDLKYIVTQLRKLDVEILDRIDKHDITFHHKWLDKDGKLIPDTDTGKKPKNGDRKKHITTLSTH